MSDPTPAKADETTDLRDFLDLAKVYDLACTARHEASMAYHAAWDAQAARGVAVRDMELDAVTNASHIAERRKGDACTALLTAARALANQDTLAAHAAEIQAREAAEARADRLATDVDAVLTEACRMSAILLMAGEMTAQERRTARAVANGIASKVRAALPEAITPDPSHPDARGGMIPPGGNRAE